MTLSELPVLVPVMIQVISTGEHFTGRSSFSPALFLAESIEKGCA